MVYEIAGLRIRINNRFSFTDVFCRDWLSEDQFSPCDMTVEPTEASLREEKRLSPEYSDGYLENICIYRDICYRIPCRERMLLHSSVVEYDGCAYAFLGRSGTGKSTHSTLWKKYLSQTEILNGDKPILRIVDNEFFVYGTPWRGKEGLGRNARAPLKALCFLKQKAENSLIPLKPKEANTLLFSQMLIPPDAENAAATLELADKLLSSVPIYLLGCDISEDAVKVSFEGMTGKNYSVEKAKENER